MRQFVHLHVHSEYSLLDGATRIEQLCQRVAEFGSTAVALTDHGVMYGVMEFYHAARNAGLTPIVGCEAYVAPRGRFDRSLRDEAHVTLLAADVTGYRNLTALVSKGFLEGYYYKPRIDLDLLSAHQDGLIALSGCISGLVAGPLLKNDRSTALANAKAYRDIFGDRFYIELMRHGMAEQQVVNEGLLSIARELSIPIVATNDAHYLEATDAVAHDVLLCIGTGRTVAETNRLKFATDEFYVKSPQEMYDLWSDLPEACENTARIAERVDLRLPSRSFAMPEYPVPPETHADANAYLRALCETGLVERYGADRAAQDVALKERLNYELGVIEAMGYASYFLIVWDFTKFARDHDIPVGPGRGSAVGSLVAYCLHVTDLDPLAFDLIFERFLNPDRISMPDIDTDFCVDRRDEVIAYVTGKYGSDRVAQIVTFGTLAARAAVRDAGRVLGIPLADVDRVAKLIPSGPTGLSIAQAIEQIADIKMMYANNADLRKLLDTANSIEGLARNAGTHAAGVVISDRPLVEYVPLVKFAEGGVNTQYDMDWIEKIGLLKMDFLGLRNLTVMHNAVREIRRTSDERFDLAQIPLGDAKTFDMLGRGETMGVFQLESEGMKRVCAELQPSRFEDIVALVALFRPGPMEWIPQYVSSKHGRTKPRYLHPKLEPILAATYGVVVYQEQVLMIARDVAGFTMSEADELRKVVSKKLKDQVPIYRERFIAGSVRHSGMTRQLAEEIFAFIEPFAGYGFGKSHAAAYAMIAYRTAFLKANHTLAYFTALLTSVRDRTERLAEYIEDARHYDISVLPPDVNESLEDFAGVGSGGIRFGLCAIKGVGEGAVRSIIEAREREGEFRDLFDLARRIDARQVNRRVFEALVKCGATDTLPGHRGQKLAALDLALDIGARAARDAELGQATLFGALEREETTPALPRVPQATRRELLRWERETLGVFVSGHPLAEVQASLERIGAVPMRRLRTLPDESAVTVAGAVTGVRRTVTRAGGQLLVAQLEDATGACEIVVFPKSYEQFQRLFEIDQVLVVKGRLRLRERPGSKLGEDPPLELSVGANEVTRLEPIPESPHAVQGWHVEVLERGQIDRLAALIDEWPGDVPVLLHASGKIRRLSRTMTGDVRVRTELARIFGDAGVRDAVE